MILKTKDLERPWITKGIKKSKKKQYLYLKLKKKKEMKKRKKNIKITKSFLNLLRSSQRNSVFLKNLGKSLKKQ